MIDGEYGAAVHEALAQESLDLRELLVGDVNRLRYVKRFSTALVLHQETTAEHCFYVSLYVLLICRWVERVSPATRVDVLEAVQKALLHDLDECRTGDLIRSFKHSAPDFQELCERQAKTCLTETLLKVFRQQRGPVDATLFHWQTAKDTSLEGLIVSFADWLSVLSHTWQEINCSNASMLVHQDTTMAYGATFQASEYDFIRPLVDQAQALAVDIFTDMRQPRTPFEETSKP